MPALFAILGLNQDMVVLIILAFILFVVFGKKLPEVGRSLGKGIIEFKKGMKGLEDDVHDGYSAPAAPQQQQQPMQQPQALPEVPRPPQRITAAAPKFDDQTRPQAPPSI
jgi:sec-independent protein translocase protein TatA